MNMNIESNIYEKRVEVHETVSYREVCETGIRSHVIINDQQSHSSSLPTAAACCLPHRVVDAVCRHSVRMSSRVVRRAVRCERLRQLRSMDRNSMMADDIRNSPENKRVANIETVPIRVKNQGICTISVNVPTGTGP